MKALGFNSLKVHPFHAVGFKCQPVYLHTLYAEASRMLGSQSLARFPAGWTGDRAAVDAEYAQHKRIGEATGCWKTGTLVEDDHGSSAKYIAEHNLSIPISGGGNPAKKQKV